MKKKWIYIIGLVLFLLIALFYSLSSVNEKEKLSYKKSAKITKGKIQKKIVLIGQVTPSKIMTVNSSITGKIIDKKYSLGDSVKAGTTLLTIKPDQEKYVEYLQKKNAFYKSKIDFKEKEIEYNNSKELFNSNFITAEELRKIKNNYELAKMQFEISKNTFEIYKSKYSIDEKSVFKIIPIKAPIDGIVTEDNVEVGNYIKSALSEFNEGTVICKIGNFDKLKVNFSIAEEYFPALQKMKKVKLKDKKGIPLGVGDIIKIYPLSNKDDGYVAFNFSVEFKAPKRKIYPGSSVMAELIIAKKENCLKVPIQAINFEGNQAFVNIKEDKSIKRKNVKLGIVGNKFVEITDGVSENEEIVF